MKIKEVKDIIKYRNYLFKALEEKTKQLTYYENTQKDKRNLKKQISNINQQLDKLEKLLQKTATFNSKDFAIFLTKYLTLTDNNYYFTELIIPDFSNLEIYELPELIRVRKAKKNKIRPKNPKGDSYYFISDEIIKDYIEENIYDINDLEDFIDRVSPQNCIIFDKENVYPFRKDLRLNELYSYFPKIKKAIYELIQLKLKRPSISDEERFKIVLDKTISKNIGKSKNIYKIKEKKSNN